MSNRIVSRKYRVTPVVPPKSASENERIAVISRPRPTKQQIFQVLGNVLFYREQYQEDVKLLPYDIFEEINGHQGLGIEWDGEDREWDVHRWYDSMDIR